MKLSEQQVKFLGGGLGIILAVLSILNYINMMAAGVQNRAKEFATLESLGMTSGQIKKSWSGRGLVTGAVYPAVPGGRTASELSGLSECDSI